MTHKSPKSSVSNMLTSYASNPVNSYANASPLPLYDPQYGHNIPMFNRTTIPVMLRDGRIRFGLQMLKGPIQYNTVFMTEKNSRSPALIDLLKANGANFMYRVTAATPEIEAFIIKTLKRFWSLGLDEALTAIEWGFSCSQVVYRTTKEFKVSYDYLKLYDSESVRPLYSDSKCLVGAHIKGVLNKPDGLDLVFPKVLWHIHNRKVNPVFGQSRLEWCSIPWHESYVCYGARDIRRTWFVKNAFDGGEMRYPIGKTKVGEQEIDNLDLAVRLMSNTRTGGYRVMPDDVNPSTGQQKWSYTPPAANITPNGLMEYPEKLRYEILEAMGIPPEVAESQGDNTMGSATGRKVPMMLYYSTLAHLSDQAIYDFDIQVLKYLVLVNFKTTDYSVERVSLEDADIESSLDDVPEGGTTDLVSKTEEDTGLTV